MYVRGLESSCLGKKLEIGHEPFVTLNGVFRPTCLCVLDDHENSQVVGFEDAQAATAGIQLRELEL